MSDEAWWRDFAGRGLCDSLGIEVVALGDERVVLTMPVDTRTHQPYGILHGGASIALAETAASLGANGRIDREHFVAVGQEINGNHVRAVSEGVVTAVAEPVHVGRSSQVWSIEIRDEAQRLVCIARCTVAIVPRRG